MPTKIIIPKWTEGGTLSALAKKHGTTVDALMELNKDNPSVKNKNLIIEGGSLNVPGGDDDGSDVQDYSGVNNVNEANEVINQDQENDAASVTDSEQPETRKTIDEILAEVTKQIVPSTPKPATPNYTDTLNSYRTQYNVDALETQLSDLQAEEQDLQAAKRTRTADERGKTVATNVIEGRVSQVEREENERIDAVQRQIKNVTNQLNTKYNIINTLMTTKEMDYNAAASNYDTEFTNNITMFNVAKGIDEANKTEIEAEKDNARANAQILLNTYDTKGVSYDQLSTAEQTNLTKLGVQSGLGADFFSTVMKVSSGKEILTTIVSADDTTASIIYKDGTTKTIKTGLPERGTNPTDDETKITYKQFVKDAFSQVVGSDGYVSPSDWAKARKTWGDSTAYDVSEFDEAFRGYINPQHPQDYAGFEGYKPGFIEKTNAEKEAEGYE